MFSLGLSSYFFFSLGERMTILRVRRWSRHWSTPSLLFLSRAFIRWPSVLRAVCAAKGHGSFDVFIISICGDQIEWLDWSPERVRCSSIGSVPVLNHPIPRRTDQSAVNDRFRLTQCFVFRSVRIVPGRSHLDDWRVWSSIPSSSDYHR